MPMIYSEEGNSTPVSQSPPVVTPENMQPPPPWVYSPPTITTPPAPPNPYTPPAIIPPPPSVYSPPTINTPPAPIDVAKVDLPDGTHILKSDWITLDSDVQKVFKDDGFDKGVTYFKWKEDQKQELYEKEKAQFESENVELGDGSWISKEYYEELPDDLKKIAKEKGYKTLEEVINARYRYDKKQAQFAYEDEKWLTEVQSNALAKLDSYKVKVYLRKGDEKANYITSYDVNQYLLDSKSPGEALRTLKQAGFTNEQIQQAAKENVAMANEARAIVEKQYSTAGIAKYAGGLAADMIVPGYYTARNWGEMGAGGKALSIGLDIITIVPFAKAAGMGARTVATSGRIARLSGAAKGVGRELIAQARAPVDMIAHPVATVKGTINTVRDLGETLLHPSKLPQAVITTAEDTVRLRVTEATTPKQAMEIRDKLMQLAARGEKPLVEVNGVKYELSQSPLMKELKGGLAHATPQGEAFEKGLQVEAKPGMSSTEQGLFVSHEPLPRFAEISAFGKTGEKPAIIITSPETAKQATTTGKIYSGTAEMEMKYPVGTNLPEPKQKLFTRTGTQGTRVEIWLEKPLSNAQIAKLKTLGVIEDIKAGFKPAIQVSGDTAKLEAKNIRQLSSILEESGNVDVARALRQSERSVLRAGIRTTRTALRATVAQEYYRALGRTDLSTRTRSTYRAPERKPIAPRVEEMRTEALTRIGRREPSRTRTTRQEPTRGRVDSAEQTRVQANITRTERARAEILRREVPRTDRFRTDVARPEPPRIERPSVEPPRTLRPPWIPQEPKVPRNNNIKLAGNYKPGKKVEVQPGTLAWQQGELSSGEVIKVAEPPKYEVKTLVGRYPQGYEDTGDTPQETIQTIGGPVKRNVDVNMGVTIAHARANQKEITFTANPKVDLLTRYRELKKQSSLAKSPHPSRGKPVLLPGWSKPRAIKGVGMTRRKRVGRIQNI